MVDNHIITIKNKDSNLVIKCFDLLYESTYVDMY